MQEDIVKPIAELLDQAALDSRFSTERFPILTLLVPDLVGCARLLSSRSVISISLLPLEPVLIWSHCLSHMAQFSHGLTHCPHGSTLSLICMLRSRNFSGSCSSTYNWYLSEIF